MADQEEDFSSLPLPDRFAHKNWKVRKEAYEAAGKEFNNAQTDADPVVRQFLQDSSLWKGAVADSNVAAHQEALTALCAFLDIAGPQGCIRTRPLTVAPLVEKGLVSTKPVAKQKALEAILLFVELDKPDPVIEELLPSLSHKTPKVIAAALSAFTSIYHEFGCKTVDPKPVLKSLPKMYGHADKNVRAEAQNLTVELYRWLREGMKPLFWNDLKPVQQQDLEKLFDNVKDEPAPKPERLLRSQQAKAAAAAAQPAAADAADEAEDEAEDEGFDLEPEAVDVLPKVPKDLQERLASTKWKDRKDALDDLQAVINVPSIQEGMFDDIIRALAKCMKDANIAVVTVAANCVELLAKGLRKSFAKYRSSIMGPMLERLKERKQAVTDALGAALDAVCAAAGLGDCLEEIVACLQHKNPQVKLESTRLLTRCLKDTKVAPALPEVKQISDAATKLLTDSQETQRNAAAEILGVLLKIMGDRIMNSHLESLDDIRKAKIKEFCDSAEVKAKYKPKPAAPPPKAAAAPPAKKQVAKKPAAAAAATPKKPAAAPAPPVEEQTPGPLQPKPTARAGIPKPGAPRGLRPPSVVGPPGAKKLTQPTSSQAQASPKRNIQSPPLEEDPGTPAPKPARSLTGRPLGKPAEPAPPQPSSGMTQPLPSAERIELDELRAEVERLRSTNETLRAEHLKLTSQVHELQDQNAQLIEDHTRDVLSIKAKETQLVRARSDAENAEAASTHLQREVDRLKRELGRIGRATSPRASDYGASEIFNESRYGTNGVVATENSHSRSRTISPVGSGATPAQTPLPASSNPVQQPPQPQQQQREGKENMPFADDVKLNVNPLSPTRSAAPAPAARPFSLHAGIPKSQSPARSNSSRSIGAPPNYAAAPPTLNSRTGSSNSIPGAEGRSLGSSGSSDGGAGRDAGGGQGQAQGQGQESWRRAAEVTQNLKARIELMRQRQGMSGR